MREQRYGRILNTCSAAAILGAERVSNYGAAKTGLIGFTGVSAAEGADRRHQGQRHRTDRIHTDARALRRAASAGGTRRRRGRRE